MHDNVSHNLDRLPELLLIVKQLFQLFKEVLDRDSVDSERLVLLRELLPLGKRGIPLLAELLGLDDSRSLEFLLLHLLVNLKRANFALHGDLLLVGNTRLHSTVAIVSAIIGVYCLILEGAAESWAIFD